jgi:membrane associated rhomboid family serine protease
MSMFGSGGGSGKPQIKFGGPITPTIKTLMIINVAVFLFLMVPSITENGAQLVSMLTIVLGMTPSVFWKEYTVWMPFTYLFLHGGFFHLAMNMMVLWMFGGEVEKVFGAKRFLTYYFFCGVGSGLLVAALQSGSGTPTIGASGAIYGLLLAYGMFFPNRIIYVYMVLPVKAKWLVIGTAVIVLLSALSTPNSAISHIAHLGGFLFGFLFIKWGKIKAFLPGLFTKTKRPKAKVINMDEVKKMLDEDDDDNQQVH